MLKTDIEKINTLEEKKIYEEKLGNRILLNVLYTVVAYVMLYICFNFSTGFNGRNPFLMKPAMHGLIVVFAIFALVAAAFYLWAFKVENSCKKSLVKNHAHMFVGFALGTFIINLPKYLQIIPLESTSGFLRTILQYFKNTYFDYKLVAVLIAVVFIALCVDNFNKYRQISKITKKSLAKK